MFTFIRWIKTFHSSVEINIIEIDVYAGKRVSYVKRSSVK